jgi:hypothetical protein
MNCPYSADLCTINLKIIGDNLFFWRSQLAESQFGNIGTKIAFGTRYSKWTRWLEIAF